MNRILIIACILGLLISCNSSKQQDTCPVVEISTSSSSGYEWLSIADTTVVLLETTEASLIGSISQICTDKSEWYVRTKDNSILKFEESGKFIARIGSKGNGPGEWMSLNAMCIFDDKIYAVDGNQNRVCIYDTAGKWIQDISGTECLKFVIAMESVGNGKFLVANGISFVEGTPLYGIWNPAEPEQLTPLVSTAYSSQGNYGWAMSPLAQYKDGFLALKPLSSTVFKMNVATAECDSIINVTDCLPADIAASGDYSEAFVSTLKLQGNPIMGIHVAGDLVLMRFLRSFAMVYLPTGQWWAANTREMSLNNSPLPFVTTNITNCLENKIVCAVDASTYLNVYAENPDFNKIQPGQIDPEDNPLLMIYTIRFPEDI